MTMPSRRLSLTIMCLPAMALAAPAVRPATPNAVAQMAECRQIGADIARLACYDRAAAALDFAVTHKELTILDKEDVRRTKRNLYGFALPNLQLFGIGDKTDKDRASDDMVLDTTLRSVRAVSYGKYDMETAEQAVWRNVDLLDMPPTVGEKIHIKPGLMGSFFFKVGSDRAVKAVRVR
jgi:hypothetical protein